MLLIIVYSINFNAIRYSLSLFSMRKKGNDIYIMVLLFVHIGSKKKKRISNFVPSVSIKYSILKTAENDNDYN